MIFFKQNKNYIFFKLSSDESAKGIAINDFTIIETSQNCHDTLFIQNSIASDTYKAQENITSNGLVPSPNNIHFEAANIFLQQGFKVQLGASFTAKNELCD